MNPYPVAPAPSVPLDRSLGRTDGRATLRLRLAEAGSDYLEGALENPELGPDELAVLLRNRAATVEIVTRVARNRAWMRPHGIKLALLANPAVPPVLSRQFLPHLYWRDLAELGANLRVSPILRRDAEKLLRTRLPELSLGEKVAVARRGSRGVIEMLRDESDALVLRAVAGNPRATEADVASIAARPDVPGSFLGWVADHSSWGFRRGVRLALVRHPKTPPSSALRLTHALSHRDLLELQRDPLAPRLVRVAAERRLTGGGSAPVRPHFG